MKRIINLAIIASLILIAAGCKENKTGKKPESNSPAVNTPVIANETQLLLKDLEENGDYVNSQYFPSLIKASVVNEEIGKKNLILDLRNPGDFSKGHIQGAVSKQFSDLPEYFETGIRPFEYDKIILVCEDGQVSSYTASLLRLMGYGNVFAMRWGMSGWNKSYANTGWMKGISGKYEGNLETQVHETPVASGMPELKTGLSTGKEISEYRFKTLFKEGIDNVLISADEVFNDPSKYFIINLERKDKYDDGHIPGAVRYKPEGTLGIVDIMATIPFDKTVVVYCGTGHNSGFATAYLRLFGYDARTLKYGNNSFMHDKMVSQKTVLSWLPFTLSESNDFKVVK
jgi:rhodanese-related sulfurtransferase